jgi:hypothetical protein
LEFKATIIEQCILIHNEMRRSGALFTRVRDRLLEKNHPQVKLRMHIFNNLVCVFPPGSAFETDTDTDALLAEKARLALENIIPELYTWFTNESVDGVLRHRVCCTRAEERPEKRRVAFDTNLPRCKRGHNKTCHVEDVIRAEGRPFIEKLRPFEAESAQLQKAISIFESVLGDPNADLSWENCRGAGDPLIILEGKDWVHHAASTNKTEWGPLSDIVGLEFLHITYPDERSR